MNIKGLISGAMGGAARGYTDYAASELKKQQDLDLAKQLLLAQEEKELRIDEVKRNRDVDDVPRLSKAQAEGKVAQAATPGYLDSVQKETDAKMPGAQKDYLSAQAERARSYAGALDSGSIGGRKDKPPTKDRLTTVLNSANATIRSLKDNKPPRSNRDAYEDWVEQLSDAEELRSTALRMLRENYPDAPAGGTSTPSTPPPKSPPSGATSSQSTNRPPIDSFFK